MRKSILLVDDDDGIRQNYRDVLKDDGFAVVEHDSAENWKPIVQDNHFVLVLLDISMNGDRFAGHKMCESLKSLYPELPVVMLTSLDDEQNRSIATVNGADGYWVKSACLEDFLVDVRTLLAGRAL